MVGHGRQWKMLSVVSKWKILSPASDMYEEIHLLHRTAIKLMDLNGTQLPHRSHMWCGNESSHGLFSSENYLTINS